MSSTSKRACLTLLCIWSFAKAFSENSCSDQFSPGTGNPQRNNLDTKTCSDEASLLQSQIQRSRVGETVEAKTAAADRAKKLRRHVDSKDRSNPHEIPHVLMQTYRDERGNHKKEWLKHNPGWNYHFLDDQGAINFLSSISDEYVKAYNAIIPGAIKADFLRLAWLWKNGGVYADQDLLPQPLEQYTNKADVYMLRSELSAKDCVDQIYNAFMVSPPNSGLIKLVLDRSLANIQRRYRGRDDTCFEIAGPMLLAQVIREEMGKPYLTRTGEILVVDPETHQGDIHGGAKLSRFFSDPDSNVQHRYTSLCKNGLVFIEDNHTDIIEDSKQKFMVMDSSQHGGKSKYIKSIEDWFQGSDESDESDQQGGIAEDDTESNQQARNVPATSSLADLYVADVKR